MARYRLLPAYTRLFAWFKLRTDPMFSRLDELTPKRHTVLDLGCGYGIPAAWLLACSEHRRMVGMELDEDRAATAKWVLGARGSVRNARVPDEWGPERDVAAILCLDMVHYLDDTQLATMLSRAKETLAEGGKLIIRATVPANERPSFFRRVEQWRLALKGNKAQFRPLDVLCDAMDGQGLRVILKEPTAEGREEMWVVAERPSR